MSGAVSAVEKNKTVCVLCLGILFSAQRGLAYRESRRETQSLLCSSSSAQRLAASTPRKPSCSFLAQITGVECTRAGEGRMKSER